MSFAIAFSLAAHAATLAWIADGGTGTQGVALSVTYEPLRAHLKPEVAPVVGSGSGIQMPDGFPNAVREVAGDDSSHRPSAEEPAPADSGIGFSFSRDRYYSASELDVLPKPMYVPALDSVEMNGSVQEELVEVVLFVESDGVVSNAHVVSGDSLFADSVKRGLLRAIFWPGQKGGRAVASKISMQVGFPQAADKSRGQQSAR